MTSPYDKRIFRLVNRAASLEGIRAEVEANHDNNRWWPLEITDFRVRMLAAGWSTRVSYRMVSTYADVITKAQKVGFDALADSRDDELTDLVRPIGLPTTRIAYLHSLAEFIVQWEKEEIDPTAEDADKDALIRSFASEVNGASYKVAQCAVLYARGYHCGIIPVDSGMVTKLAPALGMALRSSPIAHEHMRHVLESAVRARAGDFRALAALHGHRVTIPEDADPTWWVHLVLIYFKRLYLNGPSPVLCARRPVCSRVTDCSHTRH
ncbi:hypothetical protein HY68_14365 [Streptomyces sp. AcH 505]|uniref:hypothetical protein n=1 Tax=Streptomyces sp. AcH 505 TaxID=352211 RepID=UPI0005920B1F|nr:hypothetical protein HY68_14365 [Streptomyces sp. AcH 505]